MSGTGITLYVIQIGDYGNFTIALDGGEATVKTLPYIVQPSYNITLYDIQSLSYGNHYVTVNMQDWTGGGSLVGSLIFDYAAVSDTIAGAASPSTSSSASVTVAGSPASSSVAATSSSTSHSSQ